MQTLGWDQQEPTTDRRAGDPVRFEPATGILTVGRRSLAIGTIDDNEAVLRSYLRLVISQRQPNDGTLLRLRDDDVEALAALLNLEDRELEHRLVRLLGVSAEEAARLKGRFRRMAMRSTAAAVGIGALAVLPLARAGSDPVVASSARPAAVAFADEPTYPGVRVASTSEPTTAAATAPAPLVPPAIEAPTGPVAASGVAAPADPPAPPVEPVTVVETAPAEPPPEIGDAMRIERTDDGGTLVYTESAGDPDPDDGNDIGTALVIERHPPG